MITGRRLGTISKVPAGCVLIAALFGCGGSDQTSEPVDPTGYEAGRDMYVQFCSSCHANDGSGGVGPAIADGRVASRIGGVPELSAIIEDGGDRMPGLRSRLTAEQVDAIARYVLDRL